MCYPIFLGYCESINSSIFAYACSRANTLFSQCQRYIYSYTGLASFWIGREVNDMKWIKMGVDSKKEIEKMGVDSQWNFENSKLSRPSPCFEKESL